MEPREKEMREFVPQPYKRFDLIFYFMLNWVFLGSLEKQGSGVVQLTVLAVNSTEAWWTLADVTNEGVAPVGLADLTCSSVVAGVWMARSCVEKEVSIVMTSVSCH